MCQEVFYMLLTYELINQCNNLKSNLLYVLVICTRCRIQAQRDQESKRKSKLKQFNSKIWMLGHNT